MCDLREEVTVVDDDQLGVPWVAASCNDGRRVVFIRESDEYLLDDYCAAGPKNCPVFKALTKTSVNAKKSPRPGDRGLLDLRLGLLGC